jgi:hypothetical protein
VQVTKSQKHHTWKLTSQPASQLLTDTQKKTKQQQLSVTYSSFFQLETNFSFQKKVFAGMTFLLL